MMQTLPFYDEARSPGSGTWAGIFNTHFFIDPSREIGVVVMMQTLPFYDEASMKVYAGVEEAIYKNLKVERRLVSPRVRRK